MRPGGGLPGGGLPGGGLPGGGLPGGGLPGLPGLPGGGALVGVGGRHGAAGARPSVEQNPHYVAPNESARAERDAEGNVTLYAWARMLPTSHREAPPSLWPTEVVLPLRSQMQVLSAWYGHPSDPGRRLDVSERVKALLEGHEHLGSGLGNLLRESLHRPLGLNDATSGGPDAQRRAANAKRERPEAPWTGQREDRPALNLMDINVYHDPAVRLYKESPYVPPPRYEGRFSALRPGGAQAEQLAWAVKHFEVDEVRRLLRRWPAGAALTDKEDNTLFHLAAGETARAAARREQAEELLPPRAPWEASPKTSFLGLRAAEGVCGTSRRLRRGGRPDWTMPVISWMSLVALRRGSTRPRVVCGCVPKNLVEGWVVKYQRDGPESTSLGLAVVDEKGRLQPLYADAIDAEDRVVQLLDVMVSHRQMPRPVNPHGEERLASRRPEEPPGRASGSGRPTLGPRRSS
eukprot:g708.t1